MRREEKEAATTHEEATAAETQPAQDGAAPVDAAKGADRLIKIHALLDEVTSSPWSHEVLELAMATVASLPISERDETALVWLLIVGEPSTDKTFVVLLLKTARGVYSVDTVTENFLGSGYRDDTGKAAPNIFAKLDQKCIVIKELGTVFSLRPDKVRKFLGDLQAIYDREYHKLTGTVDPIHGKAAFSIVACVTPAAIHRHQEYMAQIGPRFLIYRAPRLTEEEEREGLDMGWDPGNRKKTLDDLRGRVAAHLEACKASTRLASETPEQKDYINRLAKVVTRGRTLIRRQRNANDPDLIQQEGPFRVQQQLRTLARALVRIHGRSRVTDHELEMVRRVAVSSLPEDRASVIALLPSHPEGLTVKTCAAGIDRSEDRAKSLLDELVRVKLLTKRPGPSNGGRPETVYVPVPSFADLLTTPIKPLDHAVDLHPGGFSADADSPTRGESISGQCYRKSPGVAEGGNP